MKNYNGILFDATTGKGYLPPKEEGAEPEFTGFTWEVARWSGPLFTMPLIGVFNIFGNSVSGSLNPISFATAETTKQVLETCRRYTQEESIALAIDANNYTVGPFSRTVERYILVTNGNATERFSAGLLAASIAKRGEVTAMTSWLAELRQANII